jgi:hypothetical protein
MDTLREFYQKYDEIVKYSAYAFTGWFYPGFFFHHVTFHDPLLWKDPRRIAELRI